VIRLATRGVTTGVPLQIPSGCEMAAILELKAVLQKVLRLGSKYFLPESQIFQEQLAARAKESDSENTEKPQQTEHEPVSHGDWQRKARNSAD
jgi:hypothetical protein